MYGYACLFFLRFLLYGSRLPAFWTFISAGTRAVRLEAGLRYQRCLPILDAAHCSHSCCMRFLWVLLHACSTAVASRRLRAARPPARARAQSFRLPQLRAAITAANPRVNLGMTFPILR